MLIYRLYCPQTKMSYIGQTKNLKRRISEYRREHHYKDNYLMYSDMRKYGFNNFKLEVIKQYPRKKQLNKEEKYWISYLGSRKPFGYNISRGGNSWGWKDPLATARKISESRKKLHLRMSDINKMAMSERNKGELNPTAKLTWELVNSIRKSYIFRKTTYKSLSKKFDVAVISIKRILNNETWITNVPIIQGHSSGNSLIFPKGTQITHPKYGHCYVGGYLRDRLSLYDTATKQRLTQNAKTIDCTKRNLT